MERDFVEGVSLRDAKAVLKVYASLADWQIPLETRRRQFFESSAQLVGASAVTLCTLRDVVDGRAWRIRSSDEYGFGNRLERLREYQLAERRDDPSESVFRRLEGEHVVRSRSQLVEDGIWYKSPHVQEIRRGWEVDHCAYSMVYSDVPGEASCLSVFRPWGEKIDFGPRELRLLALLHTSVLHAVQFAPTHSAPAPRAAAGSELTPRLREVLRLLEQGMSEKQIAQALAVSAHTVHAHVTTLYRHFAVHSRGELLARTLRS